MIVICMKENEHIDNARACLKGAIDEMSRIDPRPQEHNNLVKIAQKFDRRYKIED